MNCKKIIRKILITSLLGVSILGISNKVNANDVHKTEAVQQVGIWKNNTIGWQYQNIDGSYSTNKFQKIGGSTFYFDQNGYMVTDWKYLNNNWYYFRNWGGMALGWERINGLSYYMHQDGYMAANEKVSGYYLDKSGKWIPGDWKKNFTG